MLILMLVVVMIVIAFFSFKIGYLIGENDGHFETLRQMKRNELNR